MRTKCYCFFLAISFFSVAQTNVALGSLYEEMVADDTLFTNEHLLFPVFNHWNTLQKDDVQKCNIVHIGDSHIQADFFTGKLRMLLQDEFGNAGRGFVFPYTLVRSHGNPEISFSSTANWERQSIVSPSLTCNSGLGGFSLSTKDSSVVLGLATKQPSSFFHTLKMIVPSKDFSFYIPENVNFNHESSISDTATRHHHGKTVYEFHFDQIQNSFLVEANQSHLAINGFVLEQNNSGILYHNIGVNGAKASHFLKDSLFFEQVQILQPDLIIVSLGTNESFEAIEFETFCFNITAFLDKLRNHNPKAVLLVTTPPPSRSSKKFPNTFAASYARELKLLLANEDVVVFDLFQMVTQGIAKGDFDEKLLFSADGVHFTKKGYEIKAQWFYEKIIDLYKHYLKDN